jgi:hypothetical protein
MGEGRGEGVFSQVVHFEAALDPLFQKAGSLFVKAGLPFTTAGLLSEKAGSPSATAGQLFAKASLPLPKTDQELATARSPATKAGRPFQKEDPPFITAVSLFVKVGPPLVTAGPLLWTAGRISVMSLLTELDSFALPFLQRCQSCGIEESVFICVHRVKPVCSTSHPRPVSFPPLRSSNRAARA